MTILPPDFKYNFAIFNKGKVSPILVKHGKNPTIGFLSLNLIIFIPLFLYTY